MPDEAALVGRWESFMRVREPVLKALEAARAAGEIEKPLEALVRIEAAGPWRDLLGSLEPGLAELLIVSQVEVADLAAGTEASVAGVDGKLKADFPDLRLRDVESLKINRISIDMYCNNRRTSAPVKIWYDDIVAARSYIGPRATRESK